MNKMCSQIDVRAFFLCFDDSYIPLSLTWRNNQWHGDFMNKKVTKMHRDFWQRSQGAQVQLLPLRLTGIVWTSRHQCGEVLDFVNGISRQQALKQRLDI